ncbi:unnamed protein product [Rodentolepis nana]|uniref:RIH_assoc domain-containing protein n=1 Tax=Rodentolepis nana TaxID=102285 RepID=A0A0R3TZI1_RODNA|nr:unnamed protein product [Rodentolepis nana]
MCLSRLCCIRFEGCRLLGAEGTRMIFTYLMCLQTELCDQEHLFNSDWTKPEQLFENWRPLIEMAICVIGAVQSCVANCNENRTLFVQLGGFTILLNILEPLMRCIVTILDKDDPVIRELVSWRGAKPLPLVPIRESIFKAKGSDEITMEEQLEIRLNEYRLVNSTQNEVNIVAFLCHCWRVNQEKVNEFLDEKKTEDWTPMSETEEVFVLAHHILNRINFGENMKLGIDDQITVLDIENFFKMKEAAMLIRVQMELKEMMIIPIREDIQELDHLIELSKERYENVLKRKLDIINAAIDRDSRLEEEIYILPREIMKQRKVAFEGESEAKLRTKDHNYLRVSRALRVHANEASKSNFD